MSGGRPPQPGIYDPDDWLGWWTKLHPSQVFAGELSRFVLTLLHEDPFPEGPGSGMIRFEEGGDRLEAAVNYLLEEFSTGKVFHVLSITSPGDPPRRIDG